MLYLALALLLPLPQGSRKDFLASRYLPDDRTLLCLEVPSPRLLVGERDRIFQIRCLELPIFRGLFRMGAREQPAFAAVYEKRAELGRILTSFDRGLTAATIIPQGGKNLRGVCLSGFASEASALREQPELLVALVRKARKENDQKNSRALQVLQEPLADSPVLGNVLRLTPREEQTGRWWSPDAVVAFAYKGRHAVFHTRSSHWRAGEKSRQESVAVVTELLGLGERQKRRRVPRSELAPGEALLARFELQFGKLRENEKITSDRHRDEMRMAGLGSLAGVRADLITGPGGIRERIEMRDSGEKDSVIRIFAAGKGLGDAASTLPESTLAAVSLGVNAKEATDWMYRLAALERAENDMQTAISYIRGALCLPDKNEERPSLDGLEEVVAFVLPPAAGSPLAEPGLMVRAGERKVSAREALEAVARGIARGARVISEEEGVEKLRTYGKGDDKIDYLRYRDFVRSRHALDDAYGFKFLGGGLLSVTRIGPWLVFGCNPKSLRKMRAAVREGRVLAKKAGFLGRFPKGSGRLLEGWFDLPGILNNMGTAAIMAPLFFVAVASVGGGGAVPWIETGLLKVVAAGNHFRDIAAIVDEERIVLEKTDFGLVLTHEGGTALSPTAWAGFVYACCFMDGLLTLVSAQ